MFYCYDLLVCVCVCVTGYVKTGTQSTALKYRQILNICDLICKNQT